MRILSNLEEGDTNLYCKTIPITEVEGTYWKRKHPHGSKTRELVPAGLNCKSIVSSSVLLLLLL
jgi:hypothetical protein